MIMQKSGKESCWVITDGASGNRRQAMALAERMNLPIRDIEIGLRPPWAWLAPRPLPAANLALTRGSAAFAPPWPSLAIGCGRIAAWYTRRLRALTGGRCYTVQILDPRMDSRHWDTIIAPQHDDVVGDNVLHPLGSLNPIDLPWLEDAREGHAMLAALPTPRVGVLLGGPRRGMPLDQAYLSELFASLLRRQEHEGGSLLVVASRRTPIGLLEALRPRLRSLPGLIWTDPLDGPNPYPGVLAWADRLVVSPDSVNMLSEACAVGCAVHTLIKDPLPARLARFHAALRESGRLHDLDQRASPYQPPLRETAMVASQLRRRINARAAQGELGRTPPPKS